MWSTYHIERIYYNFFNFVNFAILNALAKIKAIAHTLNPCIFYVSPVVDKIIKKITNTFSEHKIVNISFHNKFPMYGKFLGTSQAIIN